MTRKVIQLAKDTFAITLPIEFVRQHKLRKGNEVSVELKGSQLFITPGLVSRVPKHVVVDVSGFDRNNVLRVIHVYYLAGVQTVTVRFKKNSFYNKYTGKFLKIEDLFDGIRRQHPGIVIGSSSDNECVFEIVAEPEIDFLKYLGRLFFQVLNMLNESVEGLRKHTKGLYLFINELDRDTVDLTFRVLGRYLNIKGYHCESESDLLFLIISELERIGDNCQVLTKYMAPLKLRYGRLETEALESIVSWFKNYMNPLKDFNMNAYDQYFKERNELLNKLFTDKKVHPQLVSFVHSFAVHFNHLMEHRMTLYHVRQ